MTQRRYGAMVSHGIGLCVLAPLRFRDALVGDEGERRMELDTLSRGQVPSVHGMDVQFDDDDLEKVETNDRATAGFSRAIVRAFRKRMQMIRTATDERDFYAMKSLHFERMRFRPDTYSMRLNDQFRLMVELRSGPQGKTVVILAIEDYH